MKITFTFDSQEQRDLAAKFIPALADSDDVNLDGPPFRLNRFFSILRGSIGREEFVEALKAQKAKLAARSNEVS